MKKKPFYQIFVSHQWFCCSKVKLCTYVLWYSDLFSKYVVKRVFTFSLTARHLVKAHQFQLCKVYTKWKVFLNFKPNLCQKYVLSYLVNRYKIYIVQFWKKSNFLKTRIVIRIYGINFETFFNFHRTAID